MTTENRETCPTLQDFIYLLNALENAAAKERPYAADYPEKRRAVLQFVQKVLQKPTPPTGAQTAETPGPHVTGKPVHEWASGTATCLIY